MVQSLAAGLGGRRFVGQQFERLFELNILNDLRLRLWSRRSLGLRVIVVLLIYQAVDLERFGRIGTLDLDRRLDAVFVRSSPRNGVPAG